jgi:hypothetical protein
LIIRPNEQLSLILGLKTIRLRTISTRVTCHNSDNEDKLNPYFVTGFSEAEGCFHVRILKNAKYSTGYTIQLIFQISLHARDRALLHRIHNSLGGVGVVSDRGNNECVYRVCR